MADEKQENAINSKGAILIGALVFTSHASTPPFPYPQSSSKTYFSLSGLKGILLPETHQIRLLMTYIQDNIMFLIHVFWKAIWVDFPVNLATLLIPAEQLADSSLLSLADGTAFEIMPSPAILIRAISNVKTAFQQQVKYQNGVTWWGPQDQSPAVAVVTLILGVVGMKRPRRCSLKVPDLSQGRSFNTEFWLSCRNSPPDRPWFPLGPTSWSQHKNHRKCLGKNFWVTKLCTVTQKTLSPNVLFNPVLLSWSYFQTLLLPNTFWSLFDCAG